MAGAPSCLVPAVAQLRILAPDGSKHRLKRRPAYQRAESTARDARIGIWAPRGGSPAQRSALGLRLQMVLLMAP